MELNADQLELLHKKDNTFYADLFHNIDSNIAKCFGNAAIFPSNVSSYYNFRQTFYLAAFLNDLIKGKASLPRGVRKGGLGA